MEGALSRIIVERKNREFLLKMGKNFNSISELFLVGKSKLFVAIFDQLLLSANFVKCENLVVTIKYPDPRVTLLGTRQIPPESVEAFKWNFARRVERYLTSNRCEKDFVVIFTIDQEN